MSTDSDTKPDHEPKPDTERNEMATDAQTEAAADIPDEGSTEKVSLIENVPDEPPTSFRAAIRTSDIKSVLTPLRALVDEARVRITEDGVMVRAVDSANVAMDDLELGAAAFESFEASPGTLGLDLDRLADPVSLASKDDLIQLYLDSESGKLIVLVGELRYSLAVWMRRRSERNRHYPSSTYLQR